MTTERLYELFIKNNTRQGDGIRRDARFLRDYGDISLDEGFKIYLTKINKMFEINKKVVDFENFLISKGIECVQSNVSESRYYSYEGVKYRFSNHSYPTGSMTSEFTIDLGSEPYLIENIKF